MKTLKNKIDAVILDVDGTLSDEVSWLKITSILGASADEHTKIFNDYKNGNSTYIEAKSLLLSLWKNTGKNNKKFMSSMFVNWELREGAEDLVRYLSKSYKLCLISGAVDLYVETTANKLNIKDWYANTTLVWDEKENLIDFDYTLDQSTLKLKHFEHYISKYNIDSKRCVIIGDGDSDIELFKKLRYSVAVNINPHKELEKLATYKVKDLQDIKNIL